MECAIRPRLATWLRTLPLALAAGVGAAALFLVGTKAGSGPVSSQPSGLLFSSGYEKGSALGSATECSGRQCWQYLTDASTGNIGRLTGRPAGVLGRFQLLADVPVDASSVNGYMVNRIESGTGRNGGQSLYSEIKRSGCCATRPQGWGATQNPFLLEPAGDVGDLYVSYWLKLQPNLVELMGQCGSNIGHQWRGVFEWKTAGDYRVILQVNRDRDPKSCAFTGPLYWTLAGDDNANCYLYSKPASKECPPVPTNVWSEKNRSVAVPAGQWFKLEVFWHRSSGPEGRVWVAVNGEAIADHHGPNTGDWNAPINRIMVHQIYTSTAYPAFQWVDDLQVWQGFPTASPGDSWYDPPYAPH